MTRKTIVDIFSLKGKSKIVCLTSYTHSIAEIADRYCDLILVGDSVGSTIYGMDSTIGVTTEIMIAHGKAVSKACKNACIVVDMPFATYPTPDKAFEVASRILIETKCDAVKVEGGESIAGIISHLVKNGVPVMGHIGLMPQHIKVAGKYKYYGKTDESKSQLLNDAISLDNSGVFSIVLECVTETIAQQITDKVHVPTIGIGSSASCDGQILVIDDMVGLSNAEMKFVKKFANISDNIDSAVLEYSKDVRKSLFPGQGMFVK